MATMTDVIGKSKLTVSLDLDNTAKQFTSAMRKFISTASGFTADEVEAYLPEPNTYDLDPWAWEYTAFTGFKDAFKAAEAAGGLYSDMKAHVGVAEAVTAIQSAGHKVVVITARNESFADETKAGLDNIGIVPDGLFFSNDKHLFHTSNGGTIDMYLDDAPSHLDKFAKMDMPAVAFHNLYNVDSPATARLNDWADAPALLGA